MTNPEGHGEKITNAEQKHHINQRITALETAMEGTTAARLAQQFVPVVPDGGAIGQKLTPHVKKATRIRDGLRIWAPGIAASATFLVLVLVFPVPGPLALYGLAIAGFGWWHAAGRPGPVESVRMLAYAVCAAGAWIRTQLTRLAVRRGAEARRTATEGR